MRKNTPHQKRTSGFTLVELLTVIAIIAILAGILIPGVGVAMDRVNESRSKSFFNQIAIAVEAWKNEYGYYPHFDSSASTAGTDSFVVVNSSGTGGITTDELFFALTGADSDGVSLTSPQAAQFNPKRQRFITFTQSNFTSDTSGNVTQLLGDAFNNTEFVIVMDKNKDGIFNTTALADLPQLTPAEGGSTFRPSSSASVFGNVLVYSAGTGSGITTWE